MRRNKMEIRLTRQEKKSRTVLPTALLETSLHHNILDRAVALNGWKCVEPTECRPPAGRAEADSVFTSLMLGASPQWELVDTQRWHTLNVKQSDIILSAFLLFLQPPRLQCREWIPTHVNLYLKNKNWIWVQKFQNSKVQKKSVNYLFWVFWD